MKADEIKVGRFYVKNNETYVREILSEENGKVEWLAYDLTDGSSRGDASFCDITYMANWAGREATPEEVDRMDIAGARRKRSGKTTSMIEDLKPYFLQTASDEELLDEVRRRGLSF